MYAGYIQMHSRIMLPWKQTLQTLIRLLHSVYINRLSMYISSWECRWQLKKMAGKFKLFCHLLIFVSCRFLFSSKLSFSKKKSGIIPSECQSDSRSGLTSCWALSRSKLFIQDIDLSANDNSKELIQNYTVQSPATSISIKQFLFIAC